MVSKKGKRKLIYSGTAFYWFVRVNENGHRVHIISEDKKVNLEYPFFDTAIPVTPSEIRRQLDEYYGE